MASTSYLSISRTRRILDELSNRAQQLFEQSSPSGPSSETRAYLAQEWLNALNILREDFDELTHQLENAQDQAREQIDLVLSRMGEGYVALDRDGHYLAINQMAEKEIFRTPASQMLGKSFLEIFPETAMWEFSVQFNKLVTENQPVHYETISPFTRSWLEINGYPRGDFVEFYIREITDRKEMESSLHSVARFPGDDPNPVLRIDREGIIRYANPASRDLFETYNCQVDGPAPETLRSLALAALRSEEMLTIDLPVKDRFYAFNIVPIPSVGYVNLYGSDITQRRQTEEQLLESHARLQTVLNSITEAYFVLDEQWCIVDYNTVAEREIFKRPKKDLVGKIFWEEFPAAIGNEYYRQYHKAFATGQPVHFEAPSAVVPSWFEAHVYPRGGLLEIYLHNINERKQAEQERERLLAENRRQKDLLEAVLQQMPAGILIADASSGNLLMGNRHIDEIWQRISPGIHPGMQINEGEYQGFHPDGQPYMPNEWPLARSIQKGEVVRGEEVFIQRGGKPGVVSVNSAPVHDAEGEIVAGVSIFFDITTRKQIEQNSRFLASLGERLLELYDPTEIKRYASRALGEYLGVDRCVFNEIQHDKGMIFIEEDYHNGQPSLSGSYPLAYAHDIFRQNLDKGHFLIIEDIRTDPDNRVYEKVFQEMNAQSMVAIPRLKEGLRTATLIVTSSQPHAWTPEEIALLHSASDLIWLALEGARLMNNLLEVSERFNVALKNAPVSVYMLDHDLRFTWVYNPPFDFTVEQMIGKRDDELLPRDEIASLMEVKRGVLESGVGTRSELRLNRNGMECVYDVTIEPLRNVDGQVVGLTVAWIDLTGQRRLEAEMLERSAQIEIQRQILRHREMERMEVARDLHDGPLQELIGLNFAINELTMIDNPEERLENITQVQERLQQQIANVRAFCYDLRPPSLTPFGLERAIQSHLEHLAKNDVQITFHPNLMRDGKTLPEEIRLALFRAFQEALNNIQRHANATEVWLTFAFDEEKIELEIRDNGQGFKIPRQWVQLAREGHLGLVGMNERVQAIGGQIKVDSTPGQGTTIRITLPRE